jgi:large subunit ribosomal protein L22
MMAKIQKKEITAPTIDSNKESKKKVLSEYKANAKFVRISPIKLARVAKVVHGKDVEVALQILKQLPHKSAEIIYKVIHSARANAIHNHDSKTSLRVKEIVTCAGPQIKRFQPKGRGRIYQILKRTSHIFVSLNEHTKGAN